MSKLFGNLSAEALEVAAGPLSVEEVMDQQDVIHEIHDIEMEAGSAVVAMEDGMQAVASLEEAATNYDAILGQPESITSAHVLVAQEHLRMSAIALGVEEADLAEIVGEEVSVEDATSNPVTAMQLSRESVGDFIKKIFEQVKAFFKRIGVAIKKLYVKAVAFLNNTEKMAKKLLESVKEMDDKGNVKMTDAVAKSLRGMMAVAGLESGSIDSKSILAYHAAVNSVATIKTVNAAFSDLPEKITKSQDDKFKAGLEGIMKNLEGGLKKESFLEKISGKVKEKLGKEKAPAKAVLIPTKVTASTVNALMVQTDDEKAASDNEMDKVSAITVTKASASLEKSEIAKLKVAALSLKDVEGILNAVVKSNSKTFIDAAKKVMEEREKAIDAIEKTYKDNEDIDSAGKAYISKFVSINQSLTTSLSLDAILGNIYANKNVVSSCKLFASLHK